MCIRDRKIQVEITKVDDRGKLSLQPVIEEDAESSEEAKEEANED